MSWFCTHRQQHLPTTACCACLAAANQELPQLTKKNCKPKPPQKPPTNTTCSTLRSTQSSCLLFCPQAAHLSMPRPGRPDLQLLLSSIATRINKSLKHRQCFTSQNHKDEAQKRPEHAIPGTEPVLHHLLSSASSHALCAVGLAHTLACAPSCCRSSGARG